MLYHQKGGKVKKDLLNTHTHIFLFPFFLFSSFSIICLLFPGGSSAGLSPHAYFASSARYNMRRKSDCGGRGRAGGGGGGGGEPAAAGNQLQVRHNTYYGRGKKADVIWFVSIGQRKFLRQN